MTDRLLMGTPGREAKPSELGSPMPHPVEPGRSTVVVTAVGEAKGQANVRVRSGRERALIGIELFTGLSALAGGGLLTIRPDGSLLQAEVSALDGSPFADWRIPGILLVVLVGASFVLAALWLWKGGRHARELSIAAGLGLVVFEATEFVWVGFQPLEAVFAVVGMLVAALAWQLTSRRGAQGR